MMISRNGRLYDPGLLGWLRENGYVVTFLIGQMATIIVWGVRMDSRVDLLERTQRDQDILVARLDDRGSRSIPIVEQRLKSLEDASLTLQREFQEFNVNSGKVPVVIQLQLDMIKEQQMRLIQALDNTYNLLNEHLRNPGNEKNGRLKK